jgi:phage repressor protein C with HTH and peptisase S24 domain
MNGEELIELMDAKGVDRQGLADKLSISVHTVNSWIKGQRNIPKSKERLIKLVFKSNNKGHNVSENDEANQKKVPVYEIDVTSSIVSSFSDVKEIPSFYMDYEPFNDCDAVVTNYGDSMYPDYKNGERLAVKRIQNFDVLTWGETFLVITNSEANDLKTVKRVHPHDDNDKIILRAGNPRYSGDTIIEKKNVLALFAVKGKVSQNFI